MTFSIVNSPKLTQAFPVHTDDGSRMASVHVLTRSLGMKPKDKRPKSFSKPTEKLCICPGSNVPHWERR